MATTKATIAEQAMRILSGGHLKPDRNLDEREIMMYLDNLRDDLCKQSVYNIIKGGEYDIDPDFLSQYMNVAIATDTDRELKYITLPASRIALPKDMGIYLITPMKNQGGAFIPIRAGQSWMYNNTATINAESQTFYFPVGNKVYFQNIDPALTVVLLTLVASSKSILANDPFPIPPDYEKTMVDAIIERFGTAKQIPHDEIEDGNK